MSDHSQSATYASGLKYDAITKQHHEIDRLNQQLFPFKIFKGIESDILYNGDLDYPEDILKSFDFVIASVHSVLKMTEETAMKRLIKAIENPYTTILGHPTGRLLLSRKGYPINHVKIIDACAANKVVLELNASPYRLDIDWSWINYAIEKNVLISINPDAHDLDGIDDLQYGIASARKGFLSSGKCFNNKGLKEIEKYFSEKRK
jgi:DNA polymerase (family 10)